MSKLLVLAVIIAAVLVLFRFLGQRNAVNERRRGAVEAFDTEYDAESDTYVVRGDKTAEK
ncbi:MAG: hypothetical protein JJ899_03130 [Alphaproteobacteria bacterium]|nr:hypothetical protein [Alphaproteobacteria bacterium]